MSNTKKNNINIKKNKTFKIKLQNSCINYNYKIPIADKKILDEEEHQLKKLVKNEYKTEIQLENDFYTYVNYYWIKEEKDNRVLDKTYFSQYDNFRIKQNEVYMELIKLIKNYINNNNNDITNEIKNLYSSRMNKNIEIFEKRIVESINYIDEFIKKDDMYGLLAYINRNELSNIYSPIKWKMNANIYDPKKYISNIIIPKFPVYNIELLIDNNNDTDERKKYKAKIRHEYKDEYLQKLFNSVNKLIPVSNHIDTNNIFNIGTDFANIVVESFINNNSDYLIVTNEESKSKFGFDWALFAKKLGYKNIPKHYLIENSKYFKLIMKELNINWKNWRNWWIYTNIKMLLNISDKYYPLFFNFYRKNVEGRSVAIPEKIIHFFGFCLCFNNLINNLYKENYKNNDNINYVNQMSNDLKLIFIKIMENNKWLSPKTKKHAILKLKKIKIIIDSNKTLIEDPLLEYSNSDILLNFEKIYKWRLEKFIENDGKDLINLIDIDWVTFSIYGKQTYLVNAYYNNLNEIYIPLGILQRPFIDLNERGIIYNLSYIGYIIAHELSHCLDNNGIEYSHDGKKYNWWTKNDYKIVNKKMNNIKKQCKLFVNFDGIDIDVHQIISETISDISSLEICQNYLINYQAVKNFLVPIQITSLKEFYIYFAMNMRQLILKKAYKYQLITNPHLMDKYRVNIALSRQSLFSEIYNIKKGDKMYWNTSSFW
jgi:predicted metalloendopeptidase